jgi:hypothetical protein
MDGAIIFGRRVTGHGGLSAPIEMEETAVRKGRGLFCRSTVVIGYVIDRSWNIGLYFSDDRRVQRVPGQNQGLVSFW